jgi:hypothetical protein
MCNGANLAYKTAQELNGTATIRVLAVNDVFYIAKSSGAIPRKGPLFKIKNSIDFRKPLVTGNLVS